MKVKSSKALVPNFDEFDFSKYRPGDVIVIDLIEFQRHSYAENIMIVAAICNAASRAGLDWATDRDEIKGEFRISFS